MTPPPCFAGQLLIGAFFVNKEMKRLFLRLLNEVIYLYDGVMVNIIETSIEKERKFVLNVIAPLLSSKTYVRDAVRFYYEQKGRDI